MYRRVAAIVVALLMCPLAAGAQERGEIQLTVEDAVALALRDNRDILLQKGDIEKAKGSLEQSRAARRPKVTVGGSWDVTSGYYSKDIAMLSAQGSVAQTLYQGGAIVSSIKQAEAGMTIEEAVLDGAKLDTALAVQKGFYTLLLAYRFRDVNMRIMENSREHLAIAEEKYRKGEIAQSDVLDARARCSTTEDAYTASLVQVDSACAILDTLLSLDATVRIVPQGEFAYDPRILAYDEAFAKAIADRPQMREQEARVESQKHAIEIARSQGRPSVTASWDYYSKSRNALGLTTAKGWSDYNVVGLAVSWPIFDGWQTRAKVEQETIGLKQANLLREKVRTDIILEVTQAYLAIADAISGIRASEADIAVYRENLAVANNRFNQGLISVTGLDDADLKYRIAAFNREQAIFDYIIAKSTLEKATGGIS